jgi:hypothetical protein
MLTRNFFLIIRYAFPVRTRNLPESVSLRGTFRSREYVRVRVRV